MTSLLKSTWCKRISTAIGLIVAAVALLNGCAAKGFRDSAYGELLKEKVLRPPKALARQVRWVWYQRQMGKTTYHYSDGFQQQVSAGAGTVLPGATVSTAEMFSRRAADHKAAAERSKDPGTRAHHRGLAVQNLQAAEQAIGREQQAEQTTAAVELVGASLNALASTLKGMSAALGSDLVEGAVRWALIDAGFVGPGAPAGSVLYVYLLSDTGHGESFDGYRYDFLANLRLQQGPQVIRSANRQTSLRIYTGSDIPDRPPAGFIEAQPAHRFTGVDLGELALLMRSAAHELYHAIDGDRTR